MKLTWAEPDEIPSHKHSQIQNTMWGCVEHDIVRTQSLLQTGLPLPPAHIFKVKRALPTIHTITHLARYHIPDRTKHGAPVRAALLDPDNVKVLCKFRVCWKEEVVQVVWKALRGQSNFSGRQYLKWRAAGSLSRATFSPCMFQVVT